MQIIARARPAQLSNARRTAADADPLDMQDDVLNKKAAWPRQKPRGGRPALPRQQAKFSDLDIKLLWHKHLVAFARTRHYNRLRTEIESQGLTDQDPQVLQVRATMGCT
jgi:hypothetical protein